MMEDSDRKTQNRKFVERENDRKREKERWF